MPHGVPLQVVLYSVLQAFYESINLLLRLVQAAARLAAIAAGWPAHEAQAAQQPLHLLRRWGKLPPAERRRLCMLAWLPN